jgi:hypothetical protein
MGLIICNRTECQFCKTTNGQNFSTCVGDKSGNHKDVVINSKGLCIAFKKK